MLYPHSYTETEGGVWLDWEDPKYRTQHGLDFKLFSQRSTTNVIIMGRTVHAIAFDSPALGHGYFLRWDCVNGFNND